MRAVIEMDGGLIRNVICDEPLEVMVIDRNEIGAEESEEGEEGEKMSLQARLMDADEDELIVERLFNHVSDGEFNV
jgi:hypothetical protein